MSAFQVFSTVAGLLVLFAVLLDAFETVVLPRRVRRQFRLTSWFYDFTWKPWAGISRWIKAAGRRESFLGYFGPLSLIFLLALWAAGLIFGFTLVQYGTGEHLSTGNTPITFGLLLYHSGETFFTLGYGDITPSSGMARLLAVMEAGLGFAFLGTVIGYLPTIYSAFSRREIEISLLDSRAGSPPSAGELLLRYCQCPPYQQLDQIFQDWERWSAEVLESHISYPVLSYFRSQHNNQSWLAALTTILDATALVIAGVESVRTEQAKSTFAMARHAVVDLAQVINTAYDPNYPDRLSPEEFSRLRQATSERGLRLRTDPEAQQKLLTLRSMYEPYVHAIAQTLQISLPPWLPQKKKKDNWQAGPWDQAVQARNLASLSPHHVDDHF